MRQRALYAVLFTAALLLADVTRADDWPMFVVDGDHLDRAVRVQRQHERAASEGGQEPGAGEVLHEEHRPQERVRHAERQDVLNWVGVRPATGGGDGR